jgi:hypothetical protein
VNPSRALFRAVTGAINRKTQSLKLSRLKGSPPYRPHFSTSTVSVSASSSFPYQANRRGSSQRPVDSRRL